MTSTQVYVQNELEHVLKCYNERGLSMRQIKQASGLSKRRINHLIYTSQFIEDTNPYLHGSSKSKINVYNYTPVEKPYFTRRQRQQREISIENKINE